MSGRHKVLVVIGQLEIGGTETHLLNVLPAINSPPLEITVYALRGGGRLEPAFVEAGVRVVSPDHHSRRWLGLARTVRHLLATWRAERPAIVHFFLPEAYLLGGLCSLLAPPCCRLMSRRSLNQYQRKRPGTRVVERWLHRRMRGVLANSTDVARELVDEGVPANRLAVLFNGVRVRDTVGGPALRESLGIDRAAIVFVMVANLIPYKGHADVIAACSLARERLPAGWAMLFVGEDSGIGAECERAAVASGIGDHVHWLGRLDDPGPALDAADIALNASHEEGFSNAVLEAMAAGLPVIATRVGGNPDAVIDERTGILVAPHAPEALAGALVTLANAPVQCRAMGEAGHARVAAEFSVDACRSAYRRLYETCAARPDEPLATLLHDPVAR